MTAAIIFMLLALGIVAIRREYQRFAGDRRNYPYGWEPQPAELASRAAPSRRTELSSAFDEFDDDEEAITKA
jgi:hypothetical protein